MSKNGEIEVITGTENKMRISRGNTSIEGSSEAVEQVLVSILSTAKELISSSCSMSIEYFRSENELYSKQLSTYLSTKQTKSSERKEILKQFGDVIHTYMNLIQSEQDMEKKEALLKQYDHLFSLHSKYYLEVLGKDDDEIPKRPHLLEGLINIFKRQR